MAGKTMAVEPRIVQLSSRLDQVGWDGQLVVVEGNRDGWTGIWPSFCAAFEAHKSGQSVILVIEDEIEDGTDAETHNNLREMLREGAKMNGILTYSSTNDASAEAPAVLGLE